MSNYQIGIQNNLIISLLIFNNLIFSLGMAKGSTRPDPTRPVINPSKKGRSGAGELEVAD
jgi:hypothetical protein